MPHLPDIGITTGCPGSLGVGVAVLETRHVAIDARCLDYTPSSMEHCKREFAERALADCKRLRKMCRLSSNEEVTVPNAQDHTGWGEFVVADVSPAVGTVPLPNKSEVPAVVAPILVSVPVVSSGAASVEIPPSSDA